MNRAAMIALGLAGMILLAGCGETKREKRVHALVKQLRTGEPGKKIEAADSLGNIGAKAEGCVEALAEALDDGNLLLRGHAAYSLHKIGPDAKAALPALEKAMNRPMASPEEMWKAIREATEETNRRRANLVDLAPVRSALAISLIDTDSDHGVKMLLATLKNERTHMNARKEAAGALGKIGPRTPEVIPALKAASTQPGVGVIAKDALQVIARAANNAG